MSPFANDLERRFHQAMLGIYDAALELSPPYRASKFRNMVNELGGKEAADILLSKPQVSSGFAELFLRGNRLDISVEYLVLRNPWHELFTPDQLAVARARLRQNAFDLPADDTLLPTPNGGRRVHICLAVPNRGHLKLLEDAASSGEDEFDWWNINKTAAPKDDVVFYMRSPVSAFVAVCKVARKVNPDEVAPTEEFFGRIATG